jgi:hypothetical protein
MSDDLLTTVRRDLESRLAEAVLVQERLRAALAALDGQRGPASRAKANGTTRTRRPRTTPEAARPRGDTGARIVEFVKAHPGSTAGDVAKALDVKRNSTSTRMAQLVKSGQLVKAERGYSAA